MFPKWLKAFWRLFTGKMNEFAYFEIGIREDNKIMKFQDICVLLHDYFMKNGNLKNTIALSDGIPDEKRAVTYKITLIGNPQIDYIKIMCLKRFISKKGLRMVYLERMNK